MQPYGCESRHRHSIFCILPPHILREMARRGSTAQRNAALNTMALDTTHRVQRMMLQLLAVAPSRFVTGAPPKVHRTIYTSGNQETPSGQLVRAEGQGPVSDVAANEAYDSLGHTFDFYLEIYQRNSIDDHGLPLNAYVHYGQGYDNAFWDGKEMIFGDGDGTAGTARQRTAAQRPPYHAGLWRQAVGADLAARRWRSRGTPRRRGR